MLFFIQSTINVENPFYLVLDWVQIHVLAVPLPVHCCTISLSTSRVLDITASSVWMVIIYKEEKKIETDPHLHDSWLYSSRSTYVIVTQAINEYLDSEH